MAQYFVVGPIMHVMSSYISKRIVPAIVIVSCMSCSDPQSPIPQNDQQVFNAFWNQGKAEIATYELNQSRYGANHDGKTVMIFVTEDFSKTRHIKLDDPVKQKAEAVKVMKLNMTKEFVTGIYKYSMMSSVFTPVDYIEYPHSLKLVTSSQEWCGQSFMQARWKGSRYEIKQMSYFEAEGDTEYSLVNTILEDELWTKIRVAPNTLPQGEVKMIASSFYIQLSHKENKVYTAQTSISLLPSQYTYTIYYPELNRTLAIDFEKPFPHRILGWKETYGNNEVTTGHLLHTILSDYWMHNQPGDEVMRDSLCLNQ